MQYDYSEIIEPLLEWYDKNARILRWRSNPSPYYVWVSEIMLQQTRVEAVKAYFDRFIDTLPTIEDLAWAKEDKLLKLWEGLGYYNRVRNLQKAAITVVEEYNGQLPKDYDKLLKLSGIGSYTAGAIASIAYGIPVPAVDGNVLRVAKRIAGSYDDILKASVKKQLELDLREIMPSRPGDFNQALMELGAMVCLPNGKPLCEQCPINKSCLAFKKDIMLEIPVKTPKKPRKIQEKTVLLLEYEGKYALHQRKKTGLLAGLWEFPNMEGKYSKEQLQVIMRESNHLVCEIEALGEAKHIFSHIEWRMLGYHIKLEQKIYEEKLIWVEKAVLEQEYALPSAFQFYQKQIAF